MKWPIDYAFLLILKINKNEKYKFILQKNINLKNIPNSFFIDKSNTF